MQAQVYPVDNNQDLQRRLEDAERRLRLGRNLAQYALMLERRLQRGKPSPENYTWLAKQPQRLAAWLEMVALADSDGAVSLETVPSLQQYFNNRQQRYLVSKLAERGLITPLGDGLVAIC